MPKVIQRQREFNAGYNSKDDPITLSPNESTTLVNAYPSTGTVKPREGTKKWATAAYSSAPVLIIPFENDAYTASIAILQDGSIESILKGAPYPALISPSRGAPEEGEISYILAEQAIFVFSTIPGFNFIIEQDKDTLPFFTLRENFVHNFNTLNPDEIKSVWEVRGAPQAELSVDHEESIVTGGYSYDSDAINFRFNQLSQVFTEPGNMFCAYTITYVRRTDAAAFDAGLPQETTIWNSGEIESNGDLTENTRIIALKKFPINKESIRVEPVDRTNNSPLIMDVGEYVTGTGLDIWECVQKSVGTGMDSSAPNIANMDLTKWFVKTTYSDLVGDDNGSPNTKVYLPRVFGGPYDPDPLIPGTGADIARINDPNDSVYVDTADAYDEQLTHIRIYRTDYFNTQDEAKGALKRFLVDLPIDYVSRFGKTSWLDEISQAELLGSDHPIETFGATRPPYSRHSFYHANRIWVGGNNEIPGRTWFSSLPTDIVNTKKYLTLFYPEEDWIDLNQESGNNVCGIAETNDYLIFVMTRDVWALFRGNPNAGPNRISSTRGCVSPGSIVQVDKTIYYLSQEGPAKINGRTVELLADNKAGELWPIRGSNTLVPESVNKNIFQISVTELKTLRGVYHENTYYVSYIYEEYVPDGNGGGTFVDKSAIIGFYTSPIGDARGAFTVEFAVTQLNWIGYFAQFSANETIFFSNHTDTSNQIYTFMDKTTKSDLGILFELSSRSRRLYANPEDRFVNGELYDLLVYTVYNDINEMNIVIYADKKNIVASTDYYTDPNDGVIDQNQVYRNNIQFGFPEGVFGNFFEVEWKKVYSDQSDFQMFGFDLRYHIRKGVIPKRLRTDSSIIINLLDEGISEMQIDGDCDIFQVDKGSFLPPPPIDPCNP